jgi:hypothetical protein
MIRGYPRHASIWPGERLQLHVSTDRPRFRAALYRWGDGFEPVMRSDWLPGKHAVDAGPADDWHWPHYSLALGPPLRSGVYLAQLEDAGPRPPRLDQDAGAALFVVRAEPDAVPPPPSDVHLAGGPDAGRRPARRLLYKLPLATYHAYNRSGGGYYATAAQRAGMPLGARVSLRRPGGGIGGPVWGAPDHYDCRSPRQTFAHWDARFVRWLERSGYAVDYCTDLDIHADPALLGRYRLLVGAGHDEYWTEARRDAVEAFVEGGGNVAFFGAKLCWWRIHLVDGGTALVCRQDGPQDAHDHWWQPDGAARPEDSLSGASYRHGGGWRDGPRQTGGFRVQDASHWVFAGTGLAQGERFGHDTWPPLAGHACDGAPLAAFDHDSGKATLSTWCDRAGTPHGYQVLAACHLDRHWQDLPPRERHAAREGIHAATLGIYQRGGTVFSAGTTDWAQVIDGPRDRRVERITRNVLDRLLA